MIDFQKEGLAWLDIDLVRNEVQHIVPALDPEEHPDRSGIKYYLDLDLPEFPMSTTYETLIRLEGREKPPVQSAGALIYEGCAFRLEKLLSGRLSITAPLRNSTILSAVASLTTRYRLREIIEPAMVDRFLPARVAMRAGLALRDFVGYDHNFFSRYQSQVKQFLTWQPDNKLVSPKQREYLYFLLNFTPLPESICLRIRVTRADGSREVLTKDTISGLKQFQVVCCQVGPDVLELDSDVVKYDVWLSDAAEQRFSEARTFVIDRRPQAFERFLLFANSFGGFDTIRLLGSSSQESDVTKSISKKERQAGYGLDFSEMEIIDVVENSGIKLSTGLFEQNSALQLDYLRELLISEVILMDTDYGFEAMNLLTSNLEYSKDRPGLVERILELGRTYNDKNYSRIPAAEKLPGRAMKWVGVSSIPVLDEFGKRTGKLTFERLQRVYVDDESKVIPYAVKPNLPGDPDYIAPVVEGSIAPGSTPYPSVEIIRQISFKRNNCASDQLGTAPTVMIPAGTYGGENPGDSDELAEAKFLTYNNQEYANSAGACELNSTPVHFGIFHKIPMDGTKVIGAEHLYGPVPDLRINGVECIPNTTGDIVPYNRLTALTYPPGKYNLLLEVEYSTSSLQPCKLKIPSKGLELAVNKSGFYLFENVQVNSSDEPLTIEVVLP